MDLENISRLLKGCVFFAPDAVWMCDEALESNKNVAILHVERFFYPSQQPLRRHYSGQAALTVGCIWDRLQSNRGTARAATLTLVNIKYNPVF